MILVIKAAGPRIVIDASEIRQVEQICTIIRQKVRHFAATFLGIDLDRANPIRRGRGFILKEKLLVNSVRVSLKDQWPVLQKWQDVRRHTQVMQQNIALAQTIVREINLI